MVTTGAKTMKRQCKRLKSFVNICNLFGYAEVMPGTTLSTIKKKYLEEIHHENFVATTMKNKEELWPSLRDMLRGNEKEG
jgi:uncharacterized sporulation protein YeaH/YhbH (DUF444 family)